MKDPVYNAAKHVVRQFKKRIEPAGNIEGENLHRLRVVTKKLRALAQLYRPHSKSAGVKALVTRIKQLADCYSQSRDAEVMGLILSGLVSRQEGNEAQAAVWLIQQLALQAPHGKQQTVLLNPIDELESILDYWQKHFKAARKGALREGVVHSFSQARKWALLAQQSSSDENYHRCRKWLKCYLYQRELVDVSADKGSEAPLKSLKRLENCLGGLHDYCVLARHLGTLMAEQPGTPAMPVIACQQLANLLEARIQQEKQACCQMFEKVFSS